MGPYLKWSLVGGAVGLLAATFAFPVFQAWIREFQGLITGLAAVFAATITIGKMDATIQTMERTDEAAQRRHEQAQRQSQKALALSREIEQKSEQRHRQMMALTLRADRLKVSRSVGPFLPAIVQAIADLKSLISRTGLDDVGSQMLFVAEVENFANGIVQIIGNPRMKEAYELFEGKLAIELDASISSGHSLHAEAQSLLQDIRTRSGQAVAELEILAYSQGRIKTMMIHTMLFKGCLEGVRDGLNGLASLYLSEATALRIDI
ncbi:hypothetical protein RHEC894_CH02991 [Rhizobium sp. CIAT894]|uniref:hypothetical protein n=1 Tax=Rhizobium sp. CIAT894 TaxID=2020312 RepID=UPI000A1EBA7C|nr:hypothetical protein [Rhizobium sp. CIAT894]ARM89268.1 hypothetical protein RHEC894_CH02991 [Rhizobium sp. CIAT894]